MEDIEKLSNNGISGLCTPKYPIVLVHGICTIDDNNASWGTLPQFLHEHNIPVYFGHQLPASTIEHNAKILYENIMRIVETTKCGKVNVIAHSKGGLEMRYALAKYHLDKYVASLTTINTPHHGCKYIDFLFKKLPKSIVNLTCNIANTVISKKFKTPSDFKRMALQLTERYCSKFNSKYKEPLNIYCQSLMTVAPLKYLKSPIFYFLHPLIHKFSKNNDGIVDVNSAKWGSHFKILNKNNGISHIDIAAPSNRSKKNNEIINIYKGIFSQLTVLGY